MANNKLFKRLAGGWVESVAARSVSTIQFTFLRMFKDREILRRMKRVHRRIGGPLANEAWLMYSIARAQTQMDGDFAEVGVFKGGSASMISMGKGDKHLHLFDTFAGLPKTTEEDDGMFRDGQYACSRDQVEENLSEYSGLSFHEGLFPDSVLGTEMEDKRFAFAHFDVDLYEGTLGCLKFFYPRMTPGGIMLSHDYFLPGVRQAFDEFFEDKPEGVIDLPTTQCMVIKLPGVTQSLRGPHTAQRTAPVSGSESD